MRQYISQANIDKNGLLIISGKDFRYLHNVLRLKSGDMLSVRLPSGELQPMTMCKIDEKAKKLTLQICDVIDASKNENQPEETESLEKTEFTLFMAIPRASKFEQIVRQATECGVTKIIPVKTEFSQAGAEKMNFQSERFEKIIKEARQQSGSPVNTKIEKCLTLKETADLWKNETQNLTDSEKLALVLYERNESTVTIFEACRHSKNTSESEKSSSLKKIALFCGSEGGLSLTEIKFLQNSEFKAVHLKTNILRCETAALYGIAAIQSLL